MWNKVFIIIIITFFSSLMTVGSHEDNLTAFARNKILHDYKLADDEASTISSTAQGISDVIGEFFIKKNLRIELVICGEATYHIRDLMDKVLLKIHNQVGTEINHALDLDECFNFHMLQSTLFFTKNHENVQKFNELNNPARHPKISAGSVIFFYVQEDSKGISDYYTDRLSDHNMNFLPIYAFEFLLLNERNEMKLKMVSYYSEGKCETAEIVEINSMSKLSGRWSKELKNVDQFTNFHGCLMKFQNNLGPTFYANELKPFVGNSQNKEEKDVAQMKQKINEGHMTYRGFFPEITRVMAKRFNFTAYHQIFYQDNQYTSEIDAFVSQNGKILYTYLKFESFIRTDHSIMEQTYNHITAPYTSLNIYYLITPNEFYTNYEKLFFPFEKYAWMCFGLTFGFTFGIIFVLNRVPRWIRRIFYGIGIRSPTFNALSIFFGISMTKLPSENCARILLTMFLFLCLIFRTCYQSKMFEFMTTDMRKPLPETIDDLISMNYTMVIEQNAMQIYQDLNEEIVNGRTKYEFQFMCQRPYKEKTFS
jgi:hypothetical protein